MEMTDPFDGDRVRDVELFGQVVDVWIQPRDGEIERRRSLRVEAIEDHDVLRALMTLPEGVDLPRQAIGIDAILVLDEMLRLGAVQESNVGVVRRAVPPVELIGLAKLATDWADVQAITLLRTHAPRLVVATERLALRALKEITPEVGVAISWGGGTTEFVRCPGSQHVKPSWQRWASAEAAYRAWLRSSVSGGPPTRS